MTRSSNDQLKRIYQAFEDAYSNQLDLDNHEDFPQNEAGFYVAILVLASKHPFSDPEIQSRVVEHLAKKCARIGRTVEKSLVDVFLQIREQNEQKEVEL